MICDGIVKRDLFDRFFKVEFSSHSTITWIALNSDLIQAYQIKQYSLVKKRAQYTYTVQRTALVSYV